MKIIVTGSEGIIGKIIFRALKGAHHDVIGLDLALGHDLKDEEWLKSYFQSNNADSLINLFALNEHIKDTSAMPKSIMDFDLESLDNYLQTNVTTLFSVCRNFAYNNKESSIINFSSIYGVRPPKSSLYSGSLKHVGYSVSKAAVIALSEYLAINLAPHIRVNTIIPGGVFNNQPEKFVTDYSDNCPMQRMATPLDLLGVINLLISKESSYITGSTFRVDGGWLI